MARIIVPDTLASKVGDLERRLDAVERTPATTLKLLGTTGALSMGATAIANGGAINPPPGMYVDFTVNRGARVLSVISGVWVLNSRSLSVIQALLANNDDLNQYSGIPGNLYNDGTAGQGNAFGAPYDYCRAIGYSYANAGRRRISIQVYTPYVSPGDGSATVTIPAMTLDVYLMGD